jgi:uncharacterized membrane protein (UPF0127 family)
VTTTVGCSGKTSPDALSEPLLKDFSRSSLSIESGQATHDFTIYVADSNAERRQGLMFVESMPADVGMLFIHEISGRQSMWMKNTVLPLDMLFVRASGEIESIARDTTPGSLKSISSKGEVCCVLELNAGTTEALGINAGDTLIHPHFQSP